MQDIDRAGGVSAVMREIGRRGDILEDYLASLEREFKERIKDATIKIRFFPTFGLFPIRWRGWGGF